MFRTTVLLILLSPFFIHADEKIPADLEGSYDLREFVENGKFSDERTSIVGVIFKDGTMTVKTAAREDVAKFTIDTTQTPNEIDFKPTTGEAKTSLGIWKVDKNGLTIAFNKDGPRPKDFKGTGVGVVKFVMTRTAPKKDK
jgi:uncharacterized protein (TIGR03067 family)